MSESAPVLETQEGSHRRDKLVPLILFLAFIGMLFRPLLVHDVVAVSTGVAQGWFRLGCDVLVVLIIAVTLFIIVTGRIGAIAFNTFREAVRNRILYFILLFALVLMASSGIVQELAVSAHNRIIRDLGLASVSFFGLMVAVFVGISLVYNELERKTIYTIVSKPVHRYQFLLGKYFGLLLTIYVIVGIMTVFFFAVVNYHEMTTDDAIFDAITYRDTAGQLHAVDNPGMAQLTFTVKCMGLSAIKAVANLFGFMLSAEGVSSAILVVIGMTCLELMIVTAFAILYSSFSTPTLSAVLTVMTFAAGRLSEDLLRFADRVQRKAIEAVSAQSFADLGTWTQIKVYFAQAAVYLVPNLDSLNVSEEAVYQGHVEIWRYSALYAVLYTICVLSIAVVVFHRRNFK